MGELIQNDGSYHAWLEDCAEKACLLLFVDDATSEILAAEFVEHESFWVLFGSLQALFPPIWASRSPLRGSLQRFPGQSDQCDDHSSPNDV